MPATPAEVAAAVLAEFRDLAGAAPRLWAWLPAGSVAPRVSGRPPPEGQPTDTATVLAGQLLRVYGPGCLAAIEPALRRALRPDGSLPAVAVKRALAEAAALSAASPPSN
jgi:hypothetical protein